MRHFRFFILIIGLLGAYSALIFNLYQLQIQKGGYYAARAQSQYHLAGFLEPHRGNIYVTDKNNNLVPVAINKSYPVIFAVPKEVKDVDKTIENLSPILNLNQEELRKIITTKSSYKLLTKEVTEEQIKKIKEAGLEGIYVDEQEKRFYPFNNLTSHVIGFVGPTAEDDQVRGRYGIENYFDDWLAGQAGKIDGQVITKPVQGKDIVLTLDRNLQTESERILKDLVKKYGAAGGTIIVQQPKTGKILTLANYPDFDPNNYSSAPVGHFLNPSIQAIYEPGSVMKVITMAAGIDSGKITPETTYYDSGSLTFPDGKTIKNWDLKGHGQTTMTQVIEQSINTGAAFAESKVGHKKFYEYLANFGFEELTGITLPGEVNGNLKNIKKGGAAIDFAAASFGQGIAATPLQLINAISAIANKGKLMKPFIVNTEQSEELRNIIAPEAAGKVTKMMASAVRKAELAQVPKYNVAGKTGTAQIPNFKRGGYTDQVTNTYVGFAPASNPQFIALIKLEKPAGAPLAGQTVVPAFRELAEFILNYYNIPPDNL